MSWALAWSYRRNKFIFEIKMIPYRAEKQTYIGRSYIKNSPISIIKKSLLINIFIMVLILIGFYSAKVAAIGAICIVAYLSFIASINPFKAFYLFFGTKLTFDGLWFVDSSFLIADKIDPLVLMAIPLLILIFNKKQAIKRSELWPITSSLIYLIWVILAILINNDRLDIALLIRQSGILFGLIVGIKYIDSGSRFDFLFKVIIVSTIIPISFFIIQYLASRYGHEILFYKIDSVRGVRLSGIYYDAATAGMVNMLSLISCLYLLVFSKVEKRTKIFLVFYFSICFFAIVVGGTRSMIATALVISAIPFIKNIRQGIIYLLCISAVMYLSQEYMEMVVGRTKQDSLVAIMNYEEILTEPQYSTAFTGRVGIWQDIWQRFSQSTILQQLFGTGLSSNAHSTYFFLLLEIGYFGLLYYVGFHLIMLIILFKRRTKDPIPFLGMLSLLTILSIGISAATVTYTSFQWLIYLIVGSGISSRFYGKSKLNKVP